MTYAVIWAPEALEQLIDLTAYITTEATPEVAERYVRSVVLYCNSMNTFPHRGNKRDDLRPGLRITHYRGSTIIVLSVDDVARTVSILGVFHGGQDYEAALQE